MANNRVIIAGAGPVGLVCAIRLSHVGIPVTVVESLPNLPRDLRASTWHPPTLDLLAPYGLADRLVAEGLVSPTWQIRHHATGERAVFDLSVLEGETDHPYRLQCEQHKFGQIAHSWLTTMSDVEVRFACTLVDFAQSDGGVEVTVEQDGTRERLSGAWLIGADGAKSTVRERLGLGLSGKTYPETTILATTRFAFHDHLEGLSNVNYCWADEGTFSLLRLPGVWRCSLYADPDETVDQALTRTAIETKLQRIVPRDQPYEVDEVRPYRIHQRIVDRYRVGRVLLAGDAAHLNSPSGGMGMNGGIHDAFNLTEKLIAVMTGGDEDLLDLYGRQRRPIAEQQILAQADRNRTRMQERDPDRRRALLAELKATADDPKKAKAYLLKSSMIDGLRQAASVT